MVWKTITLECGVCHAIATHEIADKNEQQIRDWWANEHDHPVRTLDRSDEACTDNAINTHPFIDWLNTRYAWSTL